MFAYIVRRSFAGFIMLILMSFVTYMLFFMGPIHPERYACGKNCSPAQQEQTKKALGYDKPAVVQWTDFLKGTVQGRTYPDDEALQKAAPQNVVECPAPCLGYSVVNTTTVNDGDQGHLPGVDVAGADGLHHVDGGRRALRRHRGPQEGHHHRPRDRRHLAGLLCVPHFLRRALPAQVPGDQVADRPDSRVRQHRRRRGRALAAGTPAAEPDPGPVLHGRLRPDDTRVRARVPRRGLPAHREGQGSRPPAGAGQAQHARRADPAGDDGGPRPRRPDGRRDHHRDGLQLLRSRQARRSTPTRPSTCPPSSGWCWCWPRS